MFPQNNKGSNREKFGRMNVSDNNHVPHKNKEHNGLVKRLIYKQQLGIAIRL